IGPWFPATRPGGMAGRPAQAHPPLPPRSTPALARGHRVLGAFEPALEATLDRKAAVLRAADRLGPLEGEWRVLRRVVVHVLRISVALQRPPRLHWRRGRQS